MISQKNTHCAAYLVTFFWAAVLGASDESTKPQKPIKKAHQVQTSLYCSTLACWSKLPCLQHVQPFPVALHDAHFFLPSEALYLIGAYANLEHTHTVGRVMTETAIVRSGIMKDRQDRSFKLLWPFTLAGGTVSILRKKVQGGKDVAGVLFDDTQRKLFDRGVLPQDSDYFFSCRCSNDDQLAIEVFGHHNSGYPITTVLLLPTPEHTVLRKAGFIKTARRSSCKKKEEQKL